MTIKQDLDLIEHVCETEGVYEEEMARVRAFCESSILDRLQRVEEDLRLFREGHAAKCVGGCGGITTPGGMCAGCLEGARIVNRLAMDRLRQGAPIHTEGPEFLSPAEQEARCWRQLRGWFKANSKIGHVYEVRIVQYESAAVERCGVALYSCNSEDDTPLVTKSGANLGDALAHLVAWCDESIAIAMG